VFRSHLQPSSRPREPYTKIHKPSGAGTILGQGGARSKAPKFALRKSVLRGTRIAFCPKNQRSLKKGLIQNWRFLLPENPAFSKINKKN